MPIVSGGVMSTVTITQEDLEWNNLEGLEHVTICMWIMCDCMIAAVSGGLDYKLERHTLKSVLIAHRNVDTNNNGFLRWRFISVNHWWVFYISLWAK